MSEDDGSASVEKQSTSKADQQDSSSNNPGGGAEDKNNDMYDCNICLETARDPVITMCGHLFCWPCLSQWLDTRPNRPLCPVCKSAVESDKVIPLYGRGGDTVDPRSKVPPRPRGQRTEAAQGFPGFTWGDGGNGVGVQFSLGIGVFPFGFIGSIFNNGNNFDRRPEPPAPGSRQHEEEQMLNNVFMYIGIFFILWLLFV